MFQSIIDPRRRNGKIAPVVVGLESRTRRKSMGVSTITVSDTGESAPGARSTVRRCVLCSSTLHAAAPHCSDGGSDRSAAAGQPPSLRRAWRSSPSVYGAPARDGRCPSMPSFSHHTDKAERPPAPVDPNGAPLSERIAQDRNRTARACWSRRRSTSLLILSRPQNRG
jgi:hypothetical protein